MFEMNMSTPADLAALDDAALVEVIAAGTRAEAAVAAGRLAAIAELVERHCPDTDPTEGDIIDPRAYWACDNWDSTAAEVAAAMGIGHRRASGQMHIGRNLRHRLPRVGELLAEGAISYRVAKQISWLTSLITSDEALDAVDNDLAEVATRFDTLGDERLRLAINACILRRDPDAEWRSNAAAADRQVRFRGEGDSGTATMWARLFVTDAELIKRRLAAMIRNVCDDDPRTEDQRRADAFGALAAGADQLACTCTNPDCTARGDGHDARAEAIHLHVLAEQTALDPAPNGAQPSATESTVEEPTESTPPEPAEPAPTEPPPAGTSPPKQCSTPRPAVLLGEGAIPAPLLAELVRIGARTTSLRPPRCEPEPGYRPSASLAAFIRMRDLTCRFPGCGVPAERCDIDHVTPWPLGPTHASNLGCLCRKHHLLKTFGLEGDRWTVRQLPDGTQIWTSPAGITYTTVPGSRILFPDWHTETAELPKPPPQAHVATRYCRGLQMPTRRRTRAQDRAQRIKTQRQYNRDLRMAAHPSDSAGDRPP